MTDLISIPNFVREIWDLLIVTLALGYIFSGFLRKPRTELDYSYRIPGFDKQNFKLAVLSVAPAVILHELMHKFTAILLGYAATFYASFFGLGLGIFLRIINSPFIIFAPGFVSIPPDVPTLQTTLIAFAGPLTNLILFLISDIILKTRKHLSRRLAIILYLTKTINLWLFVFNMLPIPPLDGSKVFYGLFKLIFG